MRKLLLLLLLSTTINCFSQTDTNASYREERPVPRFDNDSLQEQIRVSDSMARAMQLKEDMERNERNLNSFLADQKRRNEKLKKQNMIRIGIGVGFLAIMVIGLMRRRKAKQ
jgi:hypothetical protein